MTVSISTSEYNKLLSIAKSRFPNCGNDIVHDAILLGLDYNGCLKELKGFSYNYKTANEVDLSQKYEEKVCIKCNKNLPISCFKVYKIKNTISTYNVCIECRAEYNRAFSREYYHKNKEKCIEKNRNYKKNNQEKVKATRKEYVENNKEKILEIHRNWVKNNPEKMKEYNIRRVKKNKLAKNLTIQN
ncbi:hypothetical protein [Elizabethkingia anophelis]|uniref:hypothetical protein n=1 Tax=Elizabethkingia anophelis TaxID=1117645 RepID=UPI003F19DEDF|nr:hypothetical protein [Elizabethkingia anophelis]